MDKTLDHSLAEVEAEKQGNSLRDVEAKAFSNRLSDRLAYVETEAQETKRSEARITSRNTGFHARKDEGPDSWKNTERCCAPGIRTRKLL